MKNKLLRKGLVIGLIILFIGAGVIPSISGNKTINDIRNYYPNTESGPLSISGLPDLIITYSSVHYTEDVEPGQTNWMVTWCKNQGDAPAEDFWADWYISTDNEMTIDDYEWTGSYIDYLAAGETFVDNWANGDWPDEYPYNIPGETYYVAVMADSYDEVVESNDDNNWGEIWEVTLAGQNDPPYEPSNPDPYDGETDVDIDHDLSWTGGDPDGDSVKYDVYFGTSSPPPLVASDLTDTTYDPGTLDFGVTYYWKIIAEDIYGATSEGPIWSFTTVANDPPYTPYDPNPYDGETDVDIDHDLSWTGGDPDGDPVTYDLYFGTSSPPPLIASDLTDTTYDPGLMEYITTYYWKIIAEDSYGATTEGPIWSFTTWKNNNPPDAPSNPNPADGAEDIDINADLSWTCSDPDGDSLNYDIYFGYNNPPPLIQNNQTNTVYDPGTMNYETKYYWQITAWDPDGASNTSPVWNFETIRGPNNPPNPPTIDGPSTGKAGEVYNYTFVAIDPDNDDLYYTIDWGDGNVEDWFGPIGSNEEITCSHSWFKGNFTIRARVKDTGGLKSNWTELSVTMSRDKATSGVLSLSFLDHFPLLERSLNI